MMGGIAESQLLDYTYKMTHFKVRVLALNELRDAGDVSQIITWWVARYVTSLGCTLYRRERGWDSNGGRDQKIKNIVVNSEKRYLKMVGTKV